MPPSLCWRNLLPWDQTRQWSRQLQGRGRSSVPQGAGPTARGDSQARAGVLLDADCRFGLVVCPFGERELGEAGREGNSPGRRRRCPNGIRLDVDRPVHGNAVGRRPVLHNHSGSGRRPGLGMGVGVLQAAGRARNGEGCDSVVGGEAIIHWHASKRRSSNSRSGAEWLASRARVRCSLARERSPARRWSSPRAASTRW